MNTIAIAFKHVTDARDFASQGMPKLNEVNTVISILEDLRNSLETDTQSASTSTKHIYLSYQGDIDNTLKRLALVKQRLNDEIDWQSKKKSY